MSKCKILAIVKQEGGVGKKQDFQFRSCTIKQEKVLVVDADLQANLTTYMGFDENEVEETLSALIDRYIDDEEIRAEKAILHNEEKVQV